jgi:hypothetical protein
MFMQRGANLTTAKSGRILFVDVLSAVPPFSQGTAHSLDPTVARITNLAKTATLGPLAGI